MNNNEINDGIDNKEHVCDIIEKSEMLFANIQDNTDLSVRFFSLLDGKILDEDIIDAIKIDCDEIIQVEKLAESYMSQILFYKNSIIKENDYKDILNINNELKNLENKSKKLVQQILKVK